MTWSISASGGGQGNEGSATAYFGASGPAKQKYFTGPVHEIAGRAAAFIEACLAEERAEAEAAQKEAAEVATADA